MNKILSLFDGVSCARLALEKANKRISVYYASEIDKYAISVVQDNRPDTVQLGDVLNLDQKFDLNEEFGNGIDLLIGGSPCQDLSIAKKNRKGLEGSRSSLFYEYVKILKNVKPRYFILENVASMRNSDQDIITKELFGIEPVMINAALVSAQNRKRLFWVGKLINGVYEQVSIEQPENKHIYLKDILETEVDEKFFVTGCASRTYPRIKVDNQPRSKRIETRHDSKANNLTSVQSDSMIVLLPLDKQHNEKLKSNTIRTSGRGSGINDKHNWDTIRIGQIGKTGQANRIYSPEGKSVSLSALGGGRGAKTGLYMIQQPRGYNKGGETAKDGKTPCLTSSSWDQNNHLVDGTIIRKLTPVECERLQGMPDNWTNPSGSTSNTQRYKMCGNAFNVDVVAHIIKHLDL